MTNSIIDEIRSVREQHAASFDYDLDRIFSDMQDRQRKHAADGWVIVPAPQPPDSNVGTALQRTRFAGR